MSQCQFWNIYCHLPCRSPDIAVPCISLGVTGSGGQLSIWTVRFQVTSTSSSCLAGCLFRVKLWISTIRYDVCRFIAFWLSNSAFSNLHRKVPWGCWCGTAAPSTRFPSLPFSTYSRRFLFVFWSTWSAVRLPYSVPSWPWRHISWFWVDTTAAGNESSALSTPVIATLSFRCWGFILFQLLFYFTARSGWFYFGSTWGMPHRSRGMPRISISTPDGSLGSMSGRHHQTTSFWAVQFTSQPTWVKIHKTTSICWSWSVDSRRRWSGVAASTFLIGSVGFISSENRDSRVAATSGTALISVVSTTSELSGGTAAPNATQRISWEILIVFD